MTAPAALIYHGSPMNTIEPNHFAETWGTFEAGLGALHDVVAVSTHWFTDHTDARLTTASSPDGSPPYPLN